MLLNKLLTYGKNFWLVVLPAHILGVAALFCMPEYFLSFFVLWFLVGVVGNGVAAHRYFAHYQFETYTVVHWMLGLLATLGAMIPVTVWTIMHREHHNVADSKEDNASPLTNSMWYVMYEQRFKVGIDIEEKLQQTWVKRLIIKMEKDPVIRFLNKYHYAVIHVFSIILLLINPVWCLMYWLAVAIEFFRMGCVDWYCHRGDDSGYRSYDFRDNSSNNLLVGWLGMGIGWHNTHHANPARLILTDHWWEIDVEGYVGYLLRKR
jgi:stearoyl-CoA desaturase (delta-9 desaturase)